MQIVTIDAIAGYVIRSVLGVVDTHVLSMSGKDIGVLRQEAWQKLGSHAESVGANAVVGFRFESFASPLSGGMHIMGVAAYGTAVVVDAIDD